MQNSITEIAKKLGSTILLALVWEAIAYGINPVPSGSQEQYRPPSCEPRITTGRAKCNYESGDNYEGNLVNGVPDGQGIYVYANGDRYEGRFRNGRPNGQGTFIFANDARYEGTFQDGVIVNGRVIYETGEIYEGQFGIVQEVQSGNISSQPDGRGRFTYPNGDYYEGEFFAGSPFGQGVFVRADGSRCQGQFFNQGLDARGTCTFVGGIRYEGELRGGIPHGKGTLTYPDGRRVAGEFREGKPFDGKK